jgi:hypothetical protein
MVHSSWFIVGVFIAQGSGTKLTTAFHVAPFFTLNYPARAGSTMNSSICHNNFTIKKLCNK